MKPRSVSRIATLPVALGAMLILSAQTAGAAAALVASSPTRYAALVHPPRIIRLRFSEAIVKHSSSVRLTDLAGHEVPVTPVKVPGDNTLEVRVDSRLDAGVYMVHWMSVSAVDGSKDAGRYQFTVP